MGKFSRLIQNVDIVFEKWVKFYRNHWLRLATQVIVLIICGLFIYRNSSDIIDTASSLQIHFKWVILSWLILSVNYLLIGTTSWWCILKGMGESPRWLKSANIQLNSTLAKYIPGYIWQYVGKAVMSKEVGITSVISGIAMAFELGQTLLIGIGVAFISYSAQANPDIFGLGRIYKIAFPLGILIILGSYAIAWFLPIFLPRVYKTKPLRPEFLFASVLLITMGWFLLSFSFWLLGSSLTPYITVHTFLNFIFSTTLSMVAGILVIFVPNGLGVREGVMVMILGSAFSFPLAIVFAAITRLLVTICELTSTFLMGFIYQYTENHKKDSP